MNRALFLSICLLLFIPLSGIGQQVQKRIVSGVLESQEGEPLPGVAIRIKGTDKGTVTDMEGYYSIEVPLGAVLQYSFVGFSTYEVKVTESNSIAVGGNTNTSGPKSGNKEQQHRRTSQNWSVPAAGTSKRGIAVLSDSSATYVVAGSSSYRNKRVYGPLAKIKRDRKGNFVLVPSSYAQNNRPVFQIEFTTAASRSTVNKLPELQKSYAQGRAAEGELVARGPETGEIFSWGPLISTLAYDANGQLVPWQHGLSQAQSYDPYEAFRAGWASENSLQFFSKIQEYNFRAGYTNKFGTGVLPLSQTGRHTLDFSVNNTYGRVQPKLFLNYSAAREDLPLRGANMASVLGNLFTTPPTFDLHQGYTGSKPWQQPHTYLNADGSQKSFAPGNADHPYWLLNALPDEKKTSKLLTGLELSARHMRQLSLQYNLLLDMDKVDDRFGIPPGSVGAAPALLTERSVHATRLHSNLVGTYFIRPNSNSWNAEVYGGYSFNYQQEALKRSDGVGFEGLENYTLPDAQQRTDLALSPYRRMHEVISRATFNWNGNNNHWRIVQLGLTNRMYFSNTLAPDQQQFFLPSGSLAIMLDQLQLIRHSNFISELKPYFNFANSLREAPLLYNQWHFNSLQYTPEAYRQYYEQEELYATQGLLPEKHQKWEAGLTAGFFEGKIRLNSSYYYHTTDQLLVPVFLNGQYQLQNSAKIASPGFELSLESSGNIGYEGGRWQAVLSFNRARPYVKELYHEQERLPIAGFSSISGNLIAGQPYGVLWGSRFLRDEAGQLVIGSDGFPLVDAQQGIVGNPNPDWLASFNGNIEWRSLSLLLVLDAKKGGQVWNGTQQFLNYYGRSALTAAQRNTTGYVFEGVSETGTPNQTPVDFYNPALPLQENRWQRWGQAGVAEEAVEEASWLRLNELRLSYTFSSTKKQAIGLHKAKLSLLAKNLFVLTNYSGIDPVNNLFGYQQAAGLDLFNQPNVRSYGFALTINL